MPPDRSPGSELPTTSWSLIHDAAHGAAGEQAAIAEFARRYHAPVHAYLRALTHDDDLAGELTQAFFSDRILGRRLLARADRSRGSFRPFLKRALRNFCVDHWRERSRTPAADGIRPRAAEQLPAEGTTSDPDAAFHETWVRQLLSAALNRVRARCAERRQLDHLEIFASRYLTPEEPSWAELGRRFGLDEKSARGRAETVARHFRRALRELLAIETGSPAAADEEIAMLLAHL